MSSYSRSKACAAWKWDVLLTSVDEFKTLVEEAHPKSLVVLDYYRTACGACKYILPGFVKLCKRSGAHDAPVIFLKHNVIDE